MECLTKKNLENHHQESKLVPKETKSLSLKFPFICIFLVLRMGYQFHAMILSNCIKFTKPQDKNKEYDSRRSASSNTHGGQTGVVTRIRNGKTLRPFFSTDYFKKLFSKSSPHNNVQNTIDVVV